MLASVATIVYDIIDAFYEKYFITNRLGCAVIYDCFTYYNEIELLELRLHTLTDVVDFFVIVEADRTFSGQKREFHFAGHRDRLAQFARQIIYVQVLDMPEVHDEWALQHFQRNCISRGLGNCAPDDLVIVSDADEIPHPVAIRNLSTDNEGRRLLQKYPVAFAQRTFYYFVNSAFDRIVTGSVAILFKNLTQPEQMRTIRDRAPRIRDGGWHFTYLGGPERILQKIEALGHGDKPSYKSPTPELVQASVETGDSSLHNAEGHTYRLIRLDDSFPTYMPTLIEQYPQIYRDNNNLAEPDTVFPSPAGSLFFNYPRWYWYLLKCKLSGRQPF